MAGELGLKSVPKLKNQPIDKSVWKHVLSTRARGCNLERSQSKCAFIHVFHVKSSDPGIET